MSPTCEWLWSLTQRTFSPLEPWEQACWILRVADQESLTALTTSPNRVRPPTFSSPRTPTPGDRSLMNLIIFNRLGANWGGETDKEDGDDSSGQERLDKLASFQLMMIRHAMKCEHCGPPLFSSLSISKTPLPVRSDVFSKYDVRSSFMVRTSVSATSSAGVSFPPDVSVCCPALSRSYPEIRIASFTLFSGLPFELSEATRPSVREHSRSLTLIRRIYCSPLREKDRLLNM